MSIVSYGVCSRHWIKEAGRLVILPTTRIFGESMKVYGELMEHGECRSPSATFHHSGGRQERLWKNMVLLKRSEEQLQHVAGPVKTFEPGTLCFFYRHYPGKRAETARYLGCAALIGTHSRSSWWVTFGGRAHLCATEHLRGVTPDEADRVGLDERRQSDELLRAVQEVFEKLRGLDISSLPVEDPTEPPREPEEPSRDDLDDGMETGGQSIVRKNREKQ